MCIDCVVFILEVHHGVTFNYVWRICRSSSFDNCCIDCTRAINVYFVEANSDSFKWVVF